METSLIIAELDRSRNIIHGGLVGPIGGPVDELVLQRTVHRFRQGVIVAYLVPSDGSLDAESSEFFTELGRGIVAATVGVEYGALREIKITGWRSRLRWKLAGSGNRRSSPTRRFSSSRSRSPSRHIPSFPGIDIGDIPDDFRTRFARGQVTVHQVGNGPAGRPAQLAKNARPRLARLQAEVTHDLTDSQSSTDSPPRTRAAWIRPYPYSDYSPRKALLPLFPAAPGAVRSRSANSSFNHRILTLILPAIRTSARRLEPRPQRAEWRTQRR